MDKDGSGRLEVNELIGSLRRLTLTGSSEDKLQFLFDVYDVDGKNVIGRGDNYDVALRWHCTKSSDCQVRVRGAQSNLYGVNVTKAVIGTYM